jgi:hypothetical protein
MTQLAVGNGISKSTAYTYLHEGIAVLAARAPSLLAFKKPTNGKLTDTQQMLNKAHNGLRAIGERGNSLLKMTFKALRNVSLCPWKIGDIVAAALVLLHLEHGRTT